MPVSGLYEATVPVENQSDTERRQALHKAMWQVLVKLTGDSAIVGDERAKTLINEAQNYTQQYRYQEPQGGQAKAEGKPPLRLWVSFDPAAVDEALQRQGISTWGRERPATLVWLAVDSGGERQLVGMEQSAPGGTNFLDPITRQARERGLPLLLPLMDLQDTTRLQPIDVAAGNLGSIREASQRYPADVVLAVSLSGVQDGQPNAQWTLISEQAGNDSWTTRGDTAAAALSEGINRLAERLATHYAPRTFTGEATSVRLKVNAVNSLEDYARAQNYLAGLSSVSRVDVREAQPGSVLFEVETLAGETALEQAIAIGRTLRRESDTENGQSYRLLP